MVLRNDIDYLIKDRPPFDPMEGVSRAYQSDIVQVPLQFGTDLMTNLVSAPAREFRDFSRFGQAVRSLDPGYEVPESAMTEQEIGRRELERLFEEDLLRRKPDASASERMRVRAQAVREYHDVGWIEEMGLGIIPEIPLIAATGGLSFAGAIGARAATRAGVKATANLLKHGITPEVATGVGKAISGTGQVVEKVAGIPKAIDVGMGKVVAAPFKGAGAVIRRGEQAAGRSIATDFPMPKGIKEILGARAPMRGFESLSQREVPESISRVVDAGGAKDTPAVARTREDIEDDLLLPGDQQVIPDDVMDKLANSGFRDDRYRIADWVRQNPDRSIGWEDGKGKGLYAIHANGERAGLAQSMDRINKDLEDLIPPSVTPAVAVPGKLVRSQGKKQEIFGEYPKVDDAVNVVAGTKNAEGIREGGLFPDFDISKRGTAQKDPNSLKDYRIAKKKGSDFYQVLTRELEPEAPPARVVGQPVTPAVTSPVERAPLFQPLVPAERQVAGVGEEVPTDYVAPEYLTEVRTVQGGIEIPASTLKMLESVSKMPDAQFEQLVDDVVGLLVEFKGTKRLGYKPTWKVTDSFRERLKSIGVEEGDPRFVIFLREGLQSSTGSRAGARLSLENVPVVPKMSIRAMLGRAPEEVNDLGIVMAREARVMRQYVQDEVVRLGFVPAERQVAGVGEEILEEIPDAGLGRVAGVGEEVLPALQTAEDLNLVKKGRVYYPKNRFGEADISESPIHKVVINGEDRYITHLYWEGGIGKAWFEYGSKLSPTQDISGTGVYSKKDMVEKLKNEADKGARLTTSREATEDVAGVGEEVPIVQAAEPIAITDPKLPRELSRATPNYGYQDKQFQLNFESDVDRSLYIVAQTKKSARDQDYLEFAMRATGLDEAGARAEGKAIRDHIKGIAKDADPFYELEIPRNPTGNEYRNMVMAGALRGQPGAGMVAGEEQVARLATDVQPPTAAPGQVAGDVADVEGAPVQYTGREADDLGGPPTGDPEIDRAIDLERKTQEANQAGRETLESEGTTPTYDSFKAMATAKMYAFKKGSIGVYLESKGWLKGGARTVAEGITPALGYIRKETERIWQASIMESDARNYFLTTVPNRRRELLRSLERVFGADAVAGGKVQGMQYQSAHQYSGDIAGKLDAGSLAAIDEVMAGTIKDIAENPELYRLTREQHDAIATLNAHNDLGQQKANQFGLDLSYWEPKEGGAWLPTLARDVEPVVADITSEFQRLGTTKNFKRQYPTARDRVAYNYSKGTPEGFIPELNVGKLLERADNFKADQVGSFVFGKASGGLSRSALRGKIGKEELILLEQREASYNTAIKGLDDKIKWGRKQMGARGSQMQGELSESGQEVRRLIDELRQGKDMKPEDLTAGHLDDQFFVKASQDLDDLNRSINFIGNTAADIAKSQQSLRKLLQGLKTVQRIKNKQISDSIKENYEFLPEGINRYFTKADAAAVKNIRKPSLGRGGTTFDKIYNITTNLNKTKLSGDLSPFFYQLPLAAMFRPMNTIDHFGKVVLRSNMRAGDKWLRQDFINARIEVWDKWVVDNAEALDGFTRFSGIPVAGVAETEFQTGYIPVILRKFGSKGALAGDKFEAANDAMYRILTRIQVDAYQDQVTLLKKAGYSDMDAKVAAGQAAQWIVPRFAGQASVLGLSPYRQSLERMPFTSISFVRQPLELTKEATVGMLRTMRYGATNIGAMHSPARFMDGLKKELTPSQLTAMKFAMSLVTSMGAYSMMSGYFEGQSKGLEGDALMAYAMRRVDPTSSDFWTLNIPLIGQVRIGGPMRSLGNSMAPQVFRVGDSKPLGDIPVPFGGLPRFFTSRLSPSLRAGLEGLSGEDWAGNAINADNGLAGLVNWSLWSVGAFAPISLTQIPEFMREEGAAALPDIPLITKERAEGAPERYEDVSWADMPRNLFSEFLGASVYEPGARSTRDIEAIVWAQKRGLDFETDDNGRFSFWSLNERARAEFMNDVEGGGKELHEKIKAEVQKLADAGVGNYKLQLRLYQIQDNYLDALEDVVAPKFREGNKADAYSSFKTLRDAYYNDRSLVYKQMEMDPEDEPEDITSADHSMWEYRQLFDKATVKEINGKPVDYNRWRFDGEKFGQLTSELRDEWQSGGQTVQAPDGRVIDKWEYVREQQNLIEDKYPPEVQQMTEDMRAISDSGWWDILDPDNVQPFMSAHTGGRYLEEIREYLEAPEPLRDDLLRGGQKMNVYKSLDNIYKAITDINVLSGTGGPLGIQRMRFIQENPTITNLLYEYGFEFPGKTLKQRQERVSTYGYGSVGHLSTSLP